MKIVTEYNIGDRVWVIQNNTVCSHTIDGIQFEGVTREDGTSEGVIKYKLMGTTEHFVESKEVFRTKEDLLKTL